MQTETLAIVHPPTTGDQELVSRLKEGFRDATYSVAMYSPPEVCSLDAEDLGGATLLITSPGQCIDTSGEEPVFLSKVARARARILASSGPVDNPGYRGRLKKGINFDAVFDLGFAAQADKHSEVSEVPYQFVFNGLLGEEEPVAEEPASAGERTIPWVLVGPKSERNRDLLAELFDHGVDPGGFCLLQNRVRNKIKAETSLGSRRLAATFSKARYYLWGSDRDEPYYESTRFIAPLLSGMVPCKIDPDLAAEGLDIPGIYTSVSTFQAEAANEGYRAMYRRARDFYVSKGRLGEHLSRAMRLV